jgi:hypothetical protein
MALGWCTGLFPMNSPLLGPIFFFYSPSLKVLTCLRPTSSPLRKGLPRNVLHFIFFHLVRLFLHYNSLWRRKRGIWSGWCIFFPTRRVGVSVGCVGANIERSPMGWSGCIDPGAGRALQSMRQKHCTTPRMQEKRRKGELGGEGGGGGGGRVRKRQWHEEGEPPNHGKKQSTVCNPNWQIEGSVDTIYYWAARIWVPPLRQMTVWAIWFSGDCGGNGLVEVINWVWSKVYQHTVIGFWYGGMEVRARSGKGMSFMHN